MTTLGTGIPVEVRLQRFLKVADNGCVEWQGKTNAGYGRITILGKNRILAHRLAWEIKNGSIPEGYCVLHKCDNPLCCNTEHLFLGTRGDNNLDRKLKGRGWNQNKTECREGHPYSVENTIMDKKGSRSCKICRAVSKNKWKEKYPEKYKAIYMKYNAGKKVAV